MGIIIDTVNTPWYQQVWAAVAVGCWPWQVHGVRRLLTNPDVTEIGVRRGINVTTYAYSGPKHWVFTRRIERRVD